MDNANQIQANQDESPKTGWIKPKLDVLPMSDAMAAPSPNGGADGYFVPYS